MNFKLNFFILASVTLTALTRSATAAEGDDGCCELTKPPANATEDGICIDPEEMKTEYCIQAKVATARWMTQSLAWGTLSTFHPEGGVSGDLAPFGNTYSFADGPCGNGTGTPYFYGSDMDPSFSDAAENPMVSFALSEASLTSVCVNRVEGLSACVISSSGGDPENPPCARLTLVGNLTIVPKGTEEYAFAQSALFERHPAMPSWPADHSWVVAKIDVQYIWTIDFYGGANVFTADQYYGPDGNQFFSTSSNEKKSESSGGINRQLRVR